MRYLKLSEVLILHKLIIERSGGSGGVRDFGGLQSAISQPRVTFDNKELYPKIAEKAAALCFSIIQNHPFVDGNKRVGHAAMETFLILNNLKIQATVDEEEKIILGIATGKISRKDFVKWLTEHISKI